jgi:ATP-dependent helicase HrpA
MSSPSTPSIGQLRRRLPGLMLRDERRLRRRLERARRRNDQAARQRAVAGVAEEIAAAEARVARRRALVPALSYPPELPVTAARDELLATLARSQVTIVAGETGSGKTTQLPKLCLELGAGVRGGIAHTQPRRLAARSVAARLADELDVDLGAQVGYKVRFRQQVSQDTLVTQATDGLLLAEIAHDPLLRAYDTIIVDEAHERSLNIDFLLGYLQQTLPRRPELRVVVTSATIDVDRFSAHFDDAPIVEVSGRHYPVEVRYRPLDDDVAGDGDRDQTEGVGDAVEELIAEGDGDVLVFLPSERDIHETTAALRRRSLGGAEILGLFARLSPAQQQRVFQPHDRRRVVLATNVAETSLTVPGIRAVVDAGTARVSRYSQRTKVQRLPIERVSQASADQRAGRCGREGPGVCIRLYSEADYASRPAFTDPEVQRTNLASVILQMTALGLGDVTQFPFLDPPDPRRVRAALDLLGELGAVEVDGDGATPTPTQRLTALGHTMAALPVDPRLARMVVEAASNGCLGEVTVIAAALSVRDPRQRPADQQQAADAAHARCADASSDFLSYLPLWHHLRRQRRRLSARAFKRRCAEEFLNHARVREWQALHHQLRTAAREQGLAENTESATAEAIHRSLLAGLLSQVGMRPTDTREYLGARGTRFAIWPGSALASRRPPWVMAGELVETSRLWARDVAAIEPQWVEALAGHLVERAHSEPWWDRRRGAAVVHETVTLYGVPLITGRAVPCARIDARTARELFIRHALVEGDWDTEHGFVADNRARLAELAELEHRARRRGLVATDDDLADLYDARIPAEVTCGDDFDAWWAEAGAAQPDLLTFARHQLLGEAAEAVDAEAYPDVWRQDGVALAVTYRFEPGAADDGVTIHVPLAQLGQLSPSGFDWQVPGLRRELVTALLRGLPKDLRRQLVPVGETARAVLRRLEPADEPLTRALSREVRAVTGVTVPRQAWDQASLPDHLRITFAVVDDDRTVATGCDLAALQHELAGAAHGALTRAAGPRLRQQGQTDWTFGELPACVSLPDPGGSAVGYPALVDEGDGVGVQVLASASEQRRAMWTGTRRLLRLTVPLSSRAIHARLDTDAKLALTRAPHESPAALLDDCAACAIDALMAAHGGPAWDPAGFAELADAVQNGLTETVIDVLAAVQRVLEAAGEVAQRLDAVTNPELKPSRDDARAHLDRLVHPGFVTTTGRGRLDDVVRYLRGIGVRLDKLAHDPRRDQDRLARVAEVRQAYVGLLRRLGPEADQEADEIRWMIEELRVSLFAERLGTAHRVSPQRILAAIAAVEARADAPAAGAR